MRPAVAGNFHILGKFGEFLHFPIRKLSYFPIKKFPNGEIPHVPSWETPISLTNIQNMVVYVVVTSFLRSVAFLIYALFGEISILEIPVVGIFFLSLFAGLV